ncbi:MAG: CAP domain-containing protein [Candidatus Paceibacterota bacterium]|jgi:hypothetical protein
MTIKEFGAKLKLVFIPVQENNFRPKFLDSNFLIYYLAVLLVIKFAILPSFTCLYRSPFFASITKEALVSLTNQERKSLGLGELQSNPLLDQAAALKAQDMLNFDYFSHNSPEGKTPWYWIKLTGYNYQKAGENLAIGFVDGDEVMQAWEDSPSHLANLINPGYQEMGIGVAKGDFQGQQITVVVQMFGTKLNNTSNKNASTVAAKPAAASTKQAAQAKKEVVAVPKPATTSQDLSISTSSQAASSGQIAKQLTPSQTSSSSPSSTKPEVEGAQSQILAAPLAQSQEIESKWKTGLMQFLTFDYSRIIENLNFLSLAIVMFGMMLNIFIKIRVQHKDLLLKGFFFIMIFGMLLFSDKAIIFIPHSLNQIALLS